MTNLPSRDELALEALHPAASLVHEVVDAKKILSAPETLVKYTATVASLAYFIADAMIKERSK